MAGEAPAPSKTRRKLQMHALQALGESLVELSAARLEQLELPENLFEAIQHAQRISQWGARRRQLQYIGRLMRDVDAESIRARMAQWADATHADRARLHAVEAWRERLLHEPGALDRLCAVQPGADKPHLAALIDRAHAERARADPPRAYRELFRALDAIMSK